MRNPNERGIAMITTLLVLMLMSALLVGFTTIIMSDQRYRFIDRDRGQAFYAASGGIEKLTSDLGNLFLVNVAPTAAQITALTASSEQAEHHRHHVRLAEHANRPAGQPVDDVSLQVAEDNADGRHQWLHDHVLRQRDDRAIRRCPTTRPPSRQGHTKG